MMNDKPLTHFTHCLALTLVGARFPEYKSIPVAQLPVQTIKRIDIIHAFNFSHTFSVGGGGGDGGRLLLHQGEKFHLHQHQPHYSRGGGLSPTENNFGLRSSSSLAAENPGLETPREHPFEEMPTNDS